MNFASGNFAELDANPEAVAELRANLAPDGEVTTLLFATQESELNNAAALRVYLRTNLAPGESPGVC